MKRVFGIFEAVFDIFYLVAGIIISGILLLTADDNQARFLAGMMALLLICGDTFHLFPRIKLIITGNEEQLRPALGRGKQITSVTMTVFYLMLWQLGLILFGTANLWIWTCAVYCLALIRIILCFFPQNRWYDRYPPVRWGVYRNIPFFLQGMIVAGFYFLYRSQVQGMEGMWLAIVISFACYLPVVLWSGQNPKVGMLMLPKTCAYLYILFICLSL